MSDTPEVYILALQTEAGYLMQQIPEQAWKKLSPTLRQHRQVDASCVYWIKAQTWVEDQALVKALEDWRSETYGLAF